MSRKDGQKVVLGIAVSPGNVAFVSRMCAAMSAKGFDPAKAKDALRAPVQGTLRETKAALDKATTEHAAAEQQSRILERMLSGVLFDGASTLDAWRALCGEDGKKENKKSA